MKVVIDTNVIISAALGSQTCSEVILIAIKNAQIIEPNIVSVELSRFCEKLESQQQSDDKIKKIKNFFAVFLSFCVLKNPKKILNLSTDKPDNLFLSLSLEENAVYVTGDKNALSFAKENKIKATSPGDFMKKNN